MDLIFVTLADRPELREGMWAIGSTWPEFMLHDPIAGLFYGRLAETFPEYQIVALTARATGVSTPMTCTATGWKC